MGTVTAIGSFLDGLRTALDARPGLAGVAIFTAPVSHLDIGDEAIVFAVGSVKGEYGYRIGAPHVIVSEQFSVDGRVWIVKGGSGEETIKEARDRALEILEEVHDELATNDTVSGIVRDARVVSVTLDQYVIDGGRDCRLAFDIRVQSEFTPA